MEQLAEFPESHLQITYHDDLNRISVIECARCKSSVEILDEMLLGELQCPDCDSVCVCSKDPRYASEKKFGLFPGIVQFESGMKMFVLVPLVVN